MRPEEIEKLANKIIESFTRPKNVEAICVSFYECISGYNEP